MRFLTLAILTTFFTAVFSNSAGAQITFLTSQDQNTFTTSLDANLLPFTNTFEGLSYDPGPNSLGFTGPSPSDHFAYTISANLGSSLFANGSIFGTFVGNRSLTITPTAGDFNAVGANFFATDGESEFINVPITITATSTLGQTLSTTYTPSSANEYLSIYSPDAPLSSVVFEATGNANYYASLDNLTVGITPVPEPTLILAGVAGMTMLVRRVRRRLVAAS